MQRFRLIVISCFISLCTISIQSCTTVKPFQKAYLNDSEMDLGNRLIEEFENNFQSYKEGAVGGNNGNKGSGCGCN